MTPDMFYVQSFEWIAGDCLSRSHIGFERTAERHDNAEHNNLGGFATATRTLQSISDARKDSVRNFVVGKPVYEKFLSRKGLEQRLFEHSHSPLPKRANHPCSNLGKWGGHMASEIGNYPQSHVVPIRDPKTFVGSMSCAMNAGVHLMAVPDFRFSFCHGGSSPAPKTTPRLSWPRRRATQQQSLSERSSAWGLQ